MFIRFFRTYQPATLFAIPFFLALLWIPAFIEPFRYSTQEFMPLYAWIDHYLIKFPVQIIPFLALALVTFQAIYLSHLVNEMEVLFKKSYLPVLFFGIMASAVPSLLTIHPSMVAGSILIFAFGKILRIYKNDESLPLTFDIGFLIAIASLVFLPSALFMILFYLSLIILRHFVWREWVVSTIGFLLPFGLCWLYYFWYGIENKIPFLFDENLYPKLEMNYAWKGTNLIFPSTIAVLSFLAFFKLAGNFFKNVIRTRSFQQVLFFGLVIAALPALLNPNFLGESFFLVAIFLSIFIAYFFLAVRRVWILELLFIFLLVGITFLHLR